MAGNPTGKKIRARLEKGLCIGCGKSPCVCKSTQQVRKARELARVEAAILEGTKPELEWPPNIAESVLVLHGIQSTKNAQNTGLN